MHIHILKDETMPPVQGIGYFITDMSELSKKLKVVGSKYKATVEQLAQYHKFTAKKGEVLSVPLIVRDQPVILFFAGLGPTVEKKKISLEAYRRTLAIMYRRAAHSSLDSLAIELPNPKLFGSDYDVIAKETGIVLHLTAYHFDEYITEQSRREHVVKDIYLQTDAKNIAEAEKGLEQGVIIATNVNRARHWIDLPPAVLTPVDLARKAEKIAREGNLTCTIFDEKQVIEMGMGGLAGVSKGSDQDCMLVILEYKTSKKDAPTLALVGKGITFDSGGLSIKPSTAMETMKDDMSGAAAVIATMRIIAELKPEINVIGVTPLSENLPSGKATKPGDILTFYNGKTAEVKDTDAEGRLILADGLSYAVKHYKPDAIIDIATLTGACVVALGPFFTGLMGNDQLLLEKVKIAADRTGDRVWELPLDDDFRPAVKSELADLRNIGVQKYRAGTIMGALFLEAFVNDTPWAHLDIAGTAFDVPDIPYYRHGATGAGIRLLVDLIMNWKA